MNRDDIRSLLLKNAFRQKEIRLNIEGQSVPVTLRQMTVGQRAEVQAALKVGRDGSISGGLARGFALAVVHCCLHAETGQPLFEVADVDSLINTPAGGWVESLGAEIMSLIGEAAEDAKKS